MKLPLLFCLIVSFLSAMAGDADKEDESTDGEEKTAAVKEDRNELVHGTAQIESYEPEVKDKDGIAESATCNSAEALNIIKHHIVKHKVADLLVGKTYTDVWRREVCIGFLLCVLTKFNMKDDTLSHGVKAVRADQFNTFEAKWEETAENGVFTVNGVWHNALLNNPTYTDTVRFFYADEYAIGTYTCRVAGLFIESNSWMVAISVVKDMQDSDEVKESLRKAEAVMHEIRELSGEMAKMRQENCPENI